MYKSNLSVWRGLASFLRHGRLHLLHEECQLLLFLLQTLRLLLNLPRKLSRVFLLVKHLLVFLVQTIVLVAQFVCERRDVIQRFLKRLVLML